MIQHYKDHGERVDEVLYQTVVAEIERYRQALECITAKEQYCSQEWHVNSQEDMASIAELALEGSEKSDRKKSL